MGWGSILGKIGGLASIPLTGGATSPWVIGGLLGASALGGALSNRQPKAQSGLRDLVMKQVTQRLQSGSALPAGYETSGIQGINHTYDVVRQSQSNDLTARGLSTSPVAGAVMGNSTDARAGDIARFSASLPMLQHQMQTQDLGLGADVANMRTPPSAAAGAFSDVASMLGYLMGSGKLGQGQKKNPAGVGSPALNWSLGAHV